MSPRDFLIFAAVCIVWGFSNVISKIVVGGWAVPPLFFAALRFAIVAVVTAPWLLPIPRPSIRTLAIALLMGAGNFALLFIGLKTASPSSAAIIVQSSVPFTTLLSILILKERIRWRRALGICLTLSGVILVIWRPEGVILSNGLGYIVGAAFCGSLGVVLLKGMGSVAPLRLQAWVGLVSTIPLTIATILFEQDQWSRASSAGWGFIAAILFSALIVSVIAHSTYYWLIGRYEANMIAPLTLMAPMTTIGFGVMITGDRLSGRMLLGAGLAFAGVLIVALRSKSPPMAPE